MVQSPVKKGLKVVIELDTGSFTSSKTHIETYILDSEYDRLMVTFPPSKAEFAPYLSEGTEIKAFIYSYTGIIIVDSIVFDSPYNGKMVIEFNEQHQIIQRRKYMRMVYMTDLYIEQEEGNLRVDTIDIGGGGVRFVSDQSFRDMQKITAQLRLAPFEPLVKIEGIILKKNFYKPNEYVFEFMEISEQNRNKVIQKCVELERKQNKKY